MTTIVTRAGKGSPLTNTEVDTNFTNLNTDKIELTDLSVTTNAPGAVSLSYNSGEFTFTPPDLSNFITSVSWGDILTKPTTVAGFGITDAYTKTEVNTQISNLIDSAPGTLDTLNELAAALGDDPNFATSVNTSLSNRLRVDTALQGLTAPQQSNAIANLGITTDLTNAATAYGWGDHALAGYLTTVSWGAVTGKPATFPPSAHTHLKADITDFSEADYATALQGTNADTAFSWGNHASAGYLIGNQTITLSGDVSGSGTTSIAVTIANDSHTHDTRYYTETEISNFLSGTTAKTGYNKTNWDAAFGWGDHSLEGYITGNQTITLSGDASGSGTTSINVTVANDSHTHDTRYYTETEIDNFFSGGVGATGYNRTNWDTAFGWGNHAAVGYLTEEVDTLDSVTDRGATTANTVQFGTVSTANSTFAADNATLATVTATQVASFPTSYMGGKFVICATSAGERHICELLVTHNGTIAVATQYASITTAGILATYEVDVSAGNVRILATGATAVSTEYTVSKELLS